MKHLKKLAAAVLAVVMLASTAACSGSDKTWAAKSDTMTVPVGVYIYYEYLAYQNAKLKVEDSSKPVLEQTVEEKDAAEWIKETAANYVKLMFVVEDKMKELGLELTEDEQSQITSAANSTWSQYESTLTGYGISKESYIKATSEFNVKSNKVFSAIYGAGGTNAVSDADWIAYFEENYVDFSYLMMPLVDMTTGEALDEAAANENKALVDGFAKKIAAGEMTMEQADEEVKTKLEMTGDNSTFAQDVTTSWDSLTSAYSTDFIDMLKGMEPGQAKAVATSVQGMDVYMLGLKKDISLKSNEYLGNESNHFTVLGKMKGDEFSASLDEAAASLSGVTFNDSALNSFKPSMFA